MLAKSAKNTTRKTAHVHVPVNFCIALTKSAKNTKRKISHVHKKLRLRSRLRFCSCYKSLIWTLKTHETQKLSLSSDAFLWGSRIIEYKFSLLLVAQIDILPFLGFLENYLHHFNKHTMQSSTTTFVRWVTWNPDKAWFQDSSHDERVCDSFDRANKNSARALLPDTSYRLSKLDTQQAGENGSSSVSSA